MRHVYLALAGLALAAAWINTSHAGREIKRHMLAPAERPARF